MKSEMKKPVRWGIIGCGAVTEVKSGPAYQKTDGFELAAVMRRDAVKAEDYAKRHGVKAFYTQADELIYNDDIDAVYVATPPDSHKFYALKVADAGKPCCVEKPLAPSYADSLCIQQAFEARGIPLFSAYYRRSLPLFNAVKNALDRGAIGEVRHVSWNLCKAASPLDLTGEYNWRTDQKIACGGYFDDLASHGLDLFSYLLGDFDEVKGVGRNQQSLYSSLDAIAACWSHKSGVTGAGGWNFGCDTDRDKVKIYGSQGHLEFSVFDEKPLTVYDAGGRHDFTFKNPENIQLFHVQRIADQLFRGVAHPSNGMSATHTSWVMDQITGRPRGE